MCKHTLFFPVQLEIVYFFNVSFCIPNVSWEVPQTLQLQAIPAAGKKPHAQKVQSPRPQRPPRPPRQRVLKILDHPVATAAATVVIAAAAVAAAAAAAPPPPPLLAKQVHQRPQHQLPLFWWTKKLK